MSNENRDEKNKKIKRFNCETRRARVVKFCRKIKMGRATLTLTFEFEFICTHIDYKRRATNETKKSLCSMACINSPQPPSFSTPYTTIKQKYRQNVYACIAVHTPSI